MENLLDISRLHTDMVVSNYAEMCNLLGVEKYTGNQKKAQIKTWESYFDFERSGHKYIITQIYDTPLVRKDMRRQKESIYATYIELLLMEYLAKSPDEVAYISKKSLLRLLGIISPKFDKLKRFYYKEQKERVKNETTIQPFGINTPNVLAMERQQEDIALYGRMQKALVWHEKRSGIKQVNPDYEVFENMNPLEIQNFYERVYKKANDIINSALKSMYRRRLIDYSKSYRIIEHGRVRFANDKEVEDILRVERTVLVEMGYDNIREVAYFDLLNEYYRKVHDVICEQYGWNNTFPCLKIIHLKDMISQAIPSKAEELRKMMPDQQIIELNKAVIKKLNEQAQRNVDIQEQKGERQKRLIWGFNPFTDDEFKFWYSDDYVLIQSLLAEFILKIEPEESKVLAEKIQQGYGNHKTREDDENNNNDIDNFIDEEISEE